MTNCIFLVSGPPRSQPAVLSQEEQGFSTAAKPAPTSDPPRPRKVLLRVYGIGLDALFSREKELHWLQNLSTMDIGPSLLGIFKNGRFEQYVESTTLTKDDIRNPRTSRHIAHRMCELHNIVNIFPPPEGTVPQSQENIARWIPLAKDAIKKICAKDPSKRAVIDEFDFDKLITEIEEVHRELIYVHSPIVFAHNDAQYGNILKSLDEDGELVVIDFEYAGYNTRGFDIGNHFCEWTADYHSERPSILHHDKYPTKAEQLNFLEAYMDAEIAIMYKEVNKFALTSHIMWGLWGLIQATQSEIEFDYLEYALQRLCEFRRRRDEFMSL
ncbi:MAG: kinase-like domain-containing protein [Linnemannia elongata]|nr:MAG: kinase-like domain-containing protein [Linnemannia elongata]